MRLVGVTSPVSAPTLAATVGHGEHPIEILQRAGLVPIQPLSAQMVDGDIVVTILVRPSTGRYVPRPRAAVHNEEPHAVEVPVRRQRVGAYALVVSERGLLGTVNSSLTSSHGTWALPGGGVDEGESPATAVAREVFEEGGQSIQLQRLLCIESDHWIGRSVTGVLEDFHALRIIYLATCEAPSDPVVHDLGGSTERAAWVPLDTWRRLHWTISSRNLLSRFADELVDAQRLK